MLMRDKRAAWVLTGVAPHRGTANTLEDIEVAVMTELPTRKQSLADQVSACRGAGRRGILATRRAIGKEGSPGTPGLSWVPQPAGETVLEHGFVSFARPLPQAGREIAAVQAAFLEAAYPADRLGSLPVFEDQYISTGGQLFELLSGRDRMLADVRGYLYRVFGYSMALSCHPYDLCTALIAREAGCVIERPDGGPLDYPMDTTTAVSWVGYANRELAARFRPALREALEKVAIRGLKG